METIWEKADVNDIDGKPKGVLRTKLEQKIQERWDRVDRSIY